MFYAEPCSFEYSLPIRYLYFPKLKTFMKHGILESAIFNAVLDK